MMTITTNNKETFIQRLNELLGHKDIAVLKGTFSYDQEWVRYNGGTFVLVEFTSEVSATTIIGDGVEPNEKGTKKEWRLYLKDDSGLHQLNVFDETLNQYLALEQSHGNYCLKTLTKGSPWWYNECFIIKVDEST